MTTGYRPLDILVHRTLYGDWEVMNACRFFSKTEEQAEPQHRLILSPVWGFITFEDCRSFLVQLTEGKEIGIYEI